MEWVTLGWRDGILALVVIAAVYFAAMLARLLRMGRRRKDGALDARVDESLPATRRDRPPLSQSAMVAETTGQAAMGQALADHPVATTLAVSRTASAQSAMSAYAAAAGETPRAAASAVSLAPTFAWEEAKALFGSTLNGPAELSAVPREVGFGMPLAEHLAEQTAQDWGQAPGQEAIREAASDLEEELLRMRAEIERMRREMAELRAARRVSPQYAEAMELSQRGLRPQDVADRMNISLAEAELIQALSRGRQDFDEGESDER